MVKASLRVSYQTDWMDAQILLSMQTDVRNYRTFLSMLMVVQHDALALNLFLRSKTVQTLHGLYLLNSM